VGRCAPFWAAPSRLICRLISKNKGGCRRPALFGGQLTPDCSSVAASLSARRDHGACTRCNLKLVSRA
jgi:hypothetical protein